MQRIAFEEIVHELNRILLALGFRPERAGHCATLFAEASRDGVYSHGLNRFPRFYKMIENGTIDIHAEPRQVGRIGLIEQWDGQCGPGNLNAYACMNRAIALARQNGIGCVALRNTNHWMRGGTYGRQAADAGQIGICWTNTNQNMPPWGASEPRIGNNPIIVAVPRKSGHVVLDMALAQYSYGALSSYRKRDEPLPYPGGFDRDGNLTRDPGAIAEAGRPLPIGYWKGSGLSIVLDLMATLLSDGNPTRKIPFDSLQEVGLSQVFITMDISQRSNPGAMETMADSIIDHIHASRPATDQGEVRYPGERTLEIRKENMTLGVPVDPEIWSQIKNW